MRIPDPDRIASLILETAVDNWDGEGAVPVEPQQWHRACDVLAQAAVELAGLPAPFVTACGDGAVHLQWTTPAGDRGVLEVERIGYAWSFLPFHGDRHVRLDGGTVNDALRRVEAMFFPGEA